jgi:hypothetical protein
MYDGEVLSLCDNHFLLLSYVSFILLYTLPSRRVPVPVPRLKIGLILFILVFQFIFHFCAHNNMPSWECIFLLTFPIILHNSIAKFCLHRCFIFHLALSILAVTNSYIIFVKLREVLKYTILSVVD